MQADEYRDAKLATTTRLLPDLLGPGGRRVDLRFAGDDRDVHRRPTVVLISNDAYRLDRISRFGRRNGTAPQFVVDSGGSLIDVGIDGDAVRLPPPLQFRSLPGALRVRTPVDTPGHRGTTGSPGAGRAVAALLGVLVGHPTPPSPAIQGLGTIPSG